MKPNPDKITPKDREVVNPYRRSVGELVRRLRWDLHPQSWTSRRRLAAMRNQYVGQKAVILCNGPSLLKTDFSLLRGVQTFGLNKINLLFDKTDWRPSRIVAVNQLVLEQNAEYFNQTEIPLFLNSIASKNVRSRPNVSFLHTQLSGGVVFARDVSMSVCEGYTVTFVAMELAYHLGFRKVALVGCDHNFATKGAANKAVVSGEPDLNHFDPNYFAVGQVWQLPDLFHSEIGYLHARQTFAEAGGEIVNATEGGKLEIFRRQSLTEFLHND